MFSGPLGSDIRPCKPQEVETLVLIDTIWERSK